MCHAPHSGKLGNGITTGSMSQNGMYALWGQDLTPLYGQTFGFGGGSYSVTLPAVGTITSDHDANTIILFCLSCHDGVLTSVGMMTGQTVEALPISGSGGTLHAPTLLAAAAPGIGGYYSNDHPVGGNAYVSCNGSSSGSAVTTSSEVGYNWDCTGGGSGGTKIAPGPNMTIFLGTNYTSSFWNTYIATGKSYPLATFGTSVNAVTCTTCHNQHSMTAYAAPNGNYYSTMFFVKGYYNPIPGSNSVAQFCRNCHGGNSNEMVGVYKVPTT
jgi:hypothetical protein